MEEELIITHIVKPTLKETYALLLKDDDAFIGEIIDINEADNVVVIKNTQSKKELQLLLDGIFETESALQWNPILKKLNLPPTL